MTIASRKLASGPATTMAARWADRLVDEAFAALVRAHGGEGGLIRHACGILVAEEFYVATKRNSRNLPAGAVPIVESEQFGTESDRKDQYPDTAPAGHQEVAQLVEEHHEGQDE